MPFITCKHAFLLTNPEFISSFLIKSSDPGIEMTFDFFQNVQMSNAIFLSKCKYIYKYLGYIIREMEYLFPRRNICSFLPL